MPWPYVCKYLLFQNHFFDHLFEIKCKHDVFGNTGTFPSNYTATSAGEVTLADVTGNVDQIGAWQNLDFGGTPMLTAKTLNDMLYTQLNTVAPVGPGPDSYYPVGCCVDTFKSFTKDGVETDFDILQTVFDLYENVTDTDKNTGYKQRYVIHYSTQYAYGRIVSNPISNPPPLTHTNTNTITTNYLNILTSGLLLPMPTMCLT
jgi:hypothetical protein